MQNYFLFSQLFAWNYRQDNRASAYKPLNSAIAKLKRASILFLLGLMFFCGISILIFNRHQPVIATEAPVAHQSKTVTNIPTGDRQQMLDYDLPSNSQTAITAQLPISSSSTTATEKVPKHLNSFKTESALTENKKLATEDSLVAPAIRETSSKFIDTQDKKPHFPTSLAKQLAIELPPLSSPEKYLPETFDGYIWPAQGTFTSGYGWRWGRLHQGIDIAAPVGTPVMAAAAGTVIEAEWSSGGYGNLIKLQHSDGSITVYAHNNTILVSVGQQVEQNQQIAEMGNTGNSTGSHLHFEIHSSEDLVVDPMIFLSNR